LLVNGHRVLQVASNDFKLLDQRQFTSLHK
jgi:hypothetical protein